jgi:hypothetical protein
MPDALRGMCRKVRTQLKSAEAPHDEEQLNKEEDPAWTSGLSF